MQWSWSQIYLCISAHNINSSESNSPDEFLTKNATNSQGAKLMLISSLRSHKCLYENQSNMYRTCITDCSICVFAGFDKQHNQKESSPLLILLVTCLVICLLIVVIFFVIRLQRAHSAWKKGNIRLFILQVSIIF